MRIVDANGNICNATRCLEKGEICVPRILPKRKMLIPIEHWVEIGSFTRARQV